MDGKPNPHEATSQKKNQSHNIISHYKKYTIQNENIYMFLHNESKQNHKYLALNIINH
jgi:hypothetical protein